MIAIWALLLILTRLEAAWVSVLRPLTPLEQAISAWPPTPPGPAWLERVLIAPWARWDAEWYARIVAQGYQAGDGTTQFYPLYPLLAMPLARLGLSPMAALTLVSLLAGLGMILRLEGMARRDMELRRAREATLAFVLFPVGFILFAPYAEALFLLCAVESIRAAREGHWGRAGLAAGLAALTRPQGLFLILPLLAQARRSGVSPRAWLPLLAIPLALAGWHGYRILSIEGFRAPAPGLNGLVYALLLSPHANRVVPFQGFLWPWEAMGRALGKLWTAPDVDLAINMILAAWFLLLLAWAWRRMDGGERLYTLAVTLSAFSYHTGPVHPYMGLPRHLWIAFPVFLKARPTRIALALESVGFLGLIVPYVLHAWVP